MNDAELKAIKEEAALEKKKLEIQPEPEFDLDKLAASGERVKTEKKMKKLEEKAVKGDDGINE